MRRFVATCAPHLKGAIHARISWPETSAEAKSHALSKLWTPIAMTGMWISLSNALRRRLHRGVHLALLIAGLMHFGAHGQTGAGPLPPIVGIGAHIWGLSHKDADIQIDAAAAGNFKMIRWDVPWKAVETDNGQMQIPEQWDYIVDRIRARGMESILVFGYGHKRYDNGDKPISSSAVEGFARYAGFVAKHFAGRVKYYEVWNEWNSRIGNTSRGRSEDYAVLAKRTYASVKAADSAAQVVVGGLSSSSNDSVVGYGNRESTLETLLAQGLNRYSDAFSIHPYVVYRDGPTRSFLGFKDLLTKVVRRIRQTPGLETMPIFVTEIGWPTAKDSPLGVTEDEQAQYLSDAIDLCRELGVAAVMVYELRDGNKDTADTEGSFGVLRHNFSEKPAFRQLRARK